MEYLMVAVSLSQIKQTHSQIHAQPHKVIIVFSAHVYCNFKLFATHNQLLLLLLPPYESIPRSLASLVALAFPSYLP